MEKHEAKPTKSPSYYRGKLEKGLSRANFTNASFGSLITEHNPSFSGGEAGAMAAILRNIQLSSALDLKQFMGLNKDALHNTRPLTKVVVTVGVTTSSKELLSRFLQRGMDVCRLNVCHGTKEQHNTAITHLRELLNENTSNHCGILLDLNGEIRVGRLKNKKVFLESGSEISITCDPLLEGDFKMVSFDYPGLVDVVKAGASLVMSDGVNALTVLHIDKQKKIIRARANGDITLVEQKLVYVPSATIDKSAVQFAVDKKVDFLAVAVSSADEIKSLRAQTGQKMQIIAKIATIEGFQNLDEIVQEADGVMVSRGDLGVVVPEEQVFVAQKKILSTCNAATKPVITATQMLYSMIRNPRPTRAECTDVANAVLDGSDVVMLSGETENGDYPLESLDMLVHICHKADQVERMVEYSNLFEQLVNATPNPSVSEVVASYGVRTALDIGAKLIITITETGNTTRLVAKYRPGIPIIAITGHANVASRLSITRAAIPFVVPSVVGSASVIEVALAKAKELGLCKQGDKVVAVLGDVEGLSGRTNSFKIITIP